MSTKINKKIKSIFLLMQRLAEGQELYSQDVMLQEEFFEKTGETAERGLRRYLEDIYNLYGHIVLIEKKKKELNDRKVNVYRVMDIKQDVNKIFKFFIENSDDLSWILQMIHENDPSFLKDMSSDEKTKIEKSLKKDEGIFVFKSNPFENLEDTNQKEIFKTLKKAVKNHEYRSIEYEKNKAETLENLKCLKLVYINNNWYLATENEEKAFRLLRLSFMKRVHYAKDKATFQLNRVEYYANFFLTVQNALTLANTPFKKATFKASPKIAIYFKESMKPFFPSQEFVSTEEDGSIVFTVEYTQSMEILPFVKQWQPDITIVSPDSLKKTLIKDLRRAVENHQ
ncbi:MAG: WYL domain-containing protein [Sulfurovum sp.]|nr:WYL domain-containing protein [Sulfurovum sp.]